jgi:hypothetical protein
VVTGYIAAASAVAIILQGITRWTRVKPQEAVRTSSSYVKSHGGQTILAFQVLRLLANGALFVLAIFTAAASNWSILGDIVVVISSASVFVQDTWMLLANMLSQAYALSLATLLLYTPLIKSSTISFHATVTTLGFLGAYAYRDIWPSVTLTLRPADANEGWLLWSKVIIAGIAGVFVPMYEPYVYCPYDPAVSPFGMLCRIYIDIHIRILKRSRTLSKPRPFSGSSAIRSSARWYTKHKRHHISRQICSLLNSTLTRCACSGLAAHATSTRHL